MKENCDWFSNGCERCCLDPYYLTWKAHMLFFCLPRNHCIRLASLHDQLLSKYVDIGYVHVYNKVVLSSVLQMSTVSGQLQTTSLGIQKDYWNVLGKQKIVTCEASSSETCGFVLDLSFGLRC